MRSIFYVAHESQQSLSLERQAKRRERSSLHVEWKCVALVFVTVESEECSAVSKRRVEHLCACDELFAVNQRNQWMSSVQRLERFGNVFRDDDLVSCSNECLRNSLEKRCV